MKEERTVRGAASRFTHRIAEASDVPSIMALMHISIEHNMKAFLSEPEIQAAKTTMGFDHTLLEDRTYFVIETATDPTKTMVGCGGWGLRRTLYGGSHSPGRDDRFLDPSSEPARIRAMYTHPDWTRQGIGSLLLELGESSAREAGFQTIELGSTLAGEPLYRARGYYEYGRDVHTSPGEPENVIIRMRKAL